MKKIAHPQDLQVELRHLMAYCEGPELPSREQLSLKLTHLADEVEGRTAMGYDEPDPEEQIAEDYIRENMTPFKKGRALWIPPHSIALNQTLMGTWNLWQFTLLPLFPGKQSWSSGKYRPEGLITQASWRSYQGMRDSFNITKLDLAKKIVNLIKGAETVGDSATQDMKWVESKFGVDVSPDIKAKLIREAPKMAARRWGVNALRLKKRLYPNDGSKPLDFT